MSVVPDVASAQDSLSAYRESVGDIFRRHGDDSTRLVEFKRLIDTCASMSDAESYSRAFLDLSSGGGSAFNLAVAYMYAGYFCGNNEKMTSALDYSFKGLEIADSLGLLNLKTTLLLNISTFLSGINDYDGSFQYIQKAQEVAEEAGAYSDLVDIYYNIAISYIEQELYESAIQYFRKDIETLLMLGHTNTVEQELTIHSLRIKNALKIHDTTAAVTLVDSVNRLINYVADIDDISGLSNYCISMISSNLDAIELNPSHKRDYLGYSERYLVILRNAIDSSDFKWLEKVAYNPYYACFLTASGRLDKAWAILRDADNFIGDEEYDKALFAYCKSRRNYKDAYKYFWRIYSENFKKHSLEAAIHYEKSESRTNYERRLMELQDMADSRDLEFEEQQEFNAVLRAGSIAVLAIGLAVMLVCLYYLRLRSRLNTRLRLSNETLMTATEELNMQREEVLCQTVEIQHQSKIIMAQRDNLGATNKHLMASISIARDIQKAVMVTSENLFDVLGENFIYWKPLNVVSGDFYWCTKIGERAYLVVADCTGHGVPGALLSMYGISMLNDIVWRNSQSNAAEILEIVKAAFIKSFVFDDRYFLDGIDMALAIVCRDSMTIDYAGAKRPLVIVGGGSLREYKPDKISIGNNLMREKDTFSNHVIGVEKGDMIYAFSDGIADQFGSEDGVTKFGNRQLHDILKRMAGQDVKSQQSVIETSVEQWRAGAYMAGISEHKVPQLDDQLLIGVRI